MSRASYLNDRMGLEVGLERRLMDINKDILRWVLLLAATPIWLPFLRMLWKDFNRALEEEGGVFGRPPAGREVERIRREKLADPETLVSEPWARRGEQRALRLGTRGAGRSGRGPGTVARRPPRSGSDPAAPDSAPGFRTNPTKPQRGGERGGGFR